jgi:hypothetical protein
MQLERVSDFIQKKVLFWIFLVESNGIWAVMGCKALANWPVFENRGHFMRSESLTMRISGFGLLQLLLCSTLLL